MSPLRLMLPMFGVLGIAAGPASATLFEGHADDPRGDSISDQWSLPDQAYIPIVSDNPALDLTRAQVHYDSNVGNPGSASR
jgi:hypothetical protein